MNLLKEAESLLSEAIKKEGYEVKELSVSFSDDLQKGDIVSTIAMQIAKKVGKDEKEIAKKIAQNIKSENFNKVETVGGFINLYLSDKAIKESLREASSNKVDAHNLLKGKTILVEHTDPNPFKIFHIGHLMTNAIGESLSNLFEFCGARVQRICYMGDIGKHIARAIFGLQELKLELTPENIGKAYTYGVQKEKENEQLINSINKSLYMKEGGEIWELYKKGREITLNEFERIYKRIGVKFDKYFFESEMSEPGKEIVKKNIGNVFTEDKDGSVIFQGESKGLHTRVYLTQEKLPTYEAKELALAFEKQKIEHDESYIVVANEVKDYFAVHLSALSGIEESIAKKTKPIFHGTMRLADGKMSSREGNVIKAEEILDKLKERTKNIAKDNDINLSDTEADTIAISAFRYMVLRQSPNKNINFDIEKSISFTGDSGVYLLYTVARINSLFEKGVDENDDPYCNAEVARMISRFGNVVSICLEKRDVHYLTQYLLKVAISFNKWYGSERFLEQADTPMRLATARAVQQTLIAGLSILGIKTLEKM